jgi:hypothetical protein
VRLFLDTGMRLDELAKLRVDDVNLDYGRERGRTTAAGGAVESVLLAVLVVVGAVVGVVVVGIVVEGTVVDAGGTVLGVVDGTCVGCGLPGREPAVVEGSAVVVVSSLDGVVAGGSPSSSSVIINHAPNATSPTISRANTAISAGRPRSGAGPVGRRASPATGGATASVPIGGVSNTDVALPIITVGSSPGPGNTGARDGCVTSGSPQGVAAGEACVASGLPPSPAVGAPPATGSAGWVASGSSPSPATVAWVASGSSPAVAAGVDWVASGSPLGSSGGDSSGMPPGFHADPLPFFLWCRRRRAPCTLGSAPWILTLGSLGGSATWSTATA